MLENIWWKDYDCRFLKSKYLLFNWMHWCWIFLSLFGSVWLKKNPTSTDQENKLKSDTYYGLSQSVGIWWFVHNLQAYDWLVRNIACAVTSKLLCPHFYFQMDSSCLFISLYQHMPEDWLTSMCSKFNIYPSSTNYKDHFSNHKR